MSELDQKAVEAALKYIKSKIDTLVPGERRGHPKSRK